MNFCYKNIIIQMWFKYLKVQYVRIGQLPYLL